MLLSFTAFFTASFRFYVLRGRNYTTECKRLQSPNEWSTTTVCRLNFPSQCFSTSDECCAMLTDVSKIHNVFFVVPFPLIFFLFLRSMKFTTLFFGVRYFLLQWNFLLTTCVVAKLKFIWATRASVRGFSNRNIAFMKTHRAQ